MAQLAHVIQVINSVTIVTKLIAQDFTFEKS